ncbi:MAG: TlpA disulfide reductase family protein [Burkholderiales bacterium]
MSARAFVRLLALALALCASAAFAQVGPLWSAALTRLEPEAPAFETLQGRPMIVNFWARWCVPCRDEIPELVALHDACAAEGLAVVGVALDENAVNTREFARVYDMRYPNYLAPGDGIALLRELGNELAVVPYTLVIGRDGTVVARKAGPMTREELAAHAARLLAPR